MLPTTTLSTLAAALALLGMPVSALPTPHAVTAGNGGNAYTGVGGQANGGSVYSIGSNGLGLHALNVLAGNAGYGGDAASGVAVAGSGGDVASKKLTLVSSVPTTPSLLGNLLGKRHDGGDAYTGAGGQANGGSSYAVNPSLAGLLSDASVLNLASFNGGKGGVASSGDALAGNGGSRNSVTTTALSAPAVQQVPSAGILGAVLGSSSTQSAPGLARLLARHDGGDAYTGVGGQANGGSVVQDCQDDQSLLGQLGLGNINALNVDSFNAGQGGDASSGNVLGGSAGGNGGNGGSAYSGAGGQANGGSVSTCGVNLLNVGSHNAGNGGKAASGGAIAGNSGLSGLLRL